MNHKVGLLGGYFALLFLLVYPRSQAVAQEPNEYRLQTYPNLILARPAQPGPLILGTYLEFEVRDTGTESQEKASLRFLVKKDQFGQHDMADLRDKALALSLLGPAKLKAYKSAGEAFGNDSDRIKDNLGIKFKVDGGRQSRGESLIPTTDKCNENGGIESEVELTPARENVNGTWIPGPARIETGEALISLNEPAKEPYKRRGDRCAEQPGFYYEGELQDKLYNSVPFLYELTKRAKHNIKYCRDDKEKTYWTGVLANARQLLDELRFRVHAIQTRDVLGSTAVNPAIDRRKNIISY